MRIAQLAVLLGLLLFGLTLALGWLGLRFNQGLDITANARHSLSPSSVSVLHAINTPVEVIAVIGPSPQQREAITTLVNRLQEIKPDVYLRFINPETNPAEARALDAAPGGEIILQTAGREQRLQSLSERSLTNSLRLLNREDERDIVFITGHDERSPVNVTNDDWSVVAQRLDNIGLVSREVSLVSTPYLANTVDLVVIAAPRRPYFPGELASLSDYIGRGGNLLWLSEADSNAHTGPGLQVLADTFGVDTLPGTVIDTASQALAADTPDFVLLDKLPQHPVTRLLSNPLLLPQASALSVTPLAGQRVLPLLQTPESSWTETGELSGEIAFDPNSAEVAGPLLLGVTIERDLPNGTQRIAIVGDADFGASQFVDNGGNQSFVEALMLWLAGDDEALEFVTQAAPDATLTLSQRSTVIIGLLYMIVIPLTLLGTGLVVRWRRRRA